MTKKEKIQKVNELADSIVEDALELSANILLNPFKYKQLVTDARSVLTGNLLQFTEEFERQVEHRVIPARGCVKEF